MHGQERSQRYSNKKTQLVNGPAAPISAQTGSALKQTLSTPNTAQTAQPCSCPTTPVITPPSILPPLFPPCAYPDDECARVVQHGAPPGYELEEQHAERVNVRAGAEPLGVGVLGVQVAKGAARGDGAQGVRHAVASWHAVTAQLRGGEGRGSGKKEGGLRCEPFRRLICSKRRFPGG